MGYALHFFGAEDALLYCTTHLFIYFRVI